MSMALFSVATGQANSDILRLAKMEIRRPRQGSGPDPDHTKHQQRAESDDFDSAENDQSFHEESNIDCEE